MVPIMGTLNTADVLQWTPSVPVVKGPHLNTSRWCVVVPITDPLNLSDVLQYEIPLYIWQLWSLMSLLCITYLGLISDLDYV